MELDRTKIAIRQRSVLETLDLALRVTGLYFNKLVIATAVIAIPLALLNHWAFAWIIRDETTANTNSRYLWDMSLVVFLEAPIATLLTTKFLGDTMFLQPTTWKGLLRSVWQSSGAIIWTQGLWRGGGVLLLVLLASEETVDTSGSEGLIYALAIFMFIVRSARPYINEIVLLERTPVFAKGKSASVTVGRRNRSLHNPNTGDLIARGITTSTATIALVVIVSLAISFVYSLVFNEWSWTRQIVVFLFPMAMWLGVIYGAVVRFLGYIDLRIRREGWEVELIVRAAAQELEAAT